MIEVEKRRRIIVGNWKMNKPVKDAIRLVTALKSLLSGKQEMEVVIAPNAVALHPVGIALQDAVVMVSYFNQLRAEGMPMTDALIQGGVLRLRPVVVTTITTLLGLLPLLLAQGTGAEVQRPLAVVVVFGLASSTLLTLFVIPVMYGWVGGRMRMAPS